MDNKFRNNNGTRLLKGLFIETTLSDERDSKCLYTLKDSDRHGFPSLYRLYMECEDQTEWFFAERYLDGWEHWEMLCDCGWFKPYVERWRKELELKLKARYLQLIKSVAEADTSPQAVANAKYLLEKGWEKDKNLTPKKRGRPSKEQIALEAQRILSDEDRVLQDFRRLQKELN